MNSVTPLELKQWLDDSSRAAPALLDVREGWELERAQLRGALHIPMSALGARFGELDPAAELVVLCHHGARSARVCMALEMRGFARVYNLTGGIDGWSNQVDPAVPRY